MIVAATQRDCDKRDCKATGTPQLAFAGNFNVQFGSQIDASWHVHAVTR